MTAGPTIKVQHNFKSGAVLSNVYGETAQDANDQIAGIDWGLVAAGQADMDAAFTIVGTLGARPATPGPSPAQAGPSAAYPDVPTKAAVPAAPAPATGTVCVHGQYVYKSGEKNGKKWQAYFCPAPGRTDCAPEWIR